MIVVGRPLVSPLTNCYPCYILTCVKCCVHMRSCAVSRVGIPWPRRLAKAAGRGGPLNHCVFVREGLCRAWYVCWCWCAGDQYVCVCVCGGKYRSCAWQGPTTRDWMAGDVHHLVHRKAPRGIPKSRSWPLNKTPAAADFTTRDFKRWSDHCPSLLPPQTIRINTLRLNELPC